MESPSSPCVYTPPDALGTSTGDSISILPNTIHADTPRPSETGNMSTTSVDSAGNATQQNDLIVDQLLSLSNITANLLSQKLSPWQTAAVKESVSAVLSAVGGESKNKPVDLATSPPSSDQDKSSCLIHKQCSRTIIGFSPILFPLRGSKPCRKWALQKPEPGTANVPRNCTNG